MITGFICQESDTILRFMSQLGHETDVYSACPKNLCPTLEDETFFVYAKKGELVLVLIDSVGVGKSVRAGLDFYNPQKKSHFQDITTCNHKLRVSPVWRLFHALLSMHELINKEAEPSVSVHGVLVTDARIANYDDLRQALFLQCVDFSISVYHNCPLDDSDWSASQMPLNMDFFLDGANYLRIYRHQLSMQEQKKEEVEEEEKEESVDNEFDSWFQDFFDNNSDDDDFLVSSDDNDMLLSDDEDEDPALAARIAACESPEERKRLIILQAKLAIARS